MEKENQKSEEEKFLREDLKDLKEYAKKVLQQKGLKAPKAEEDVADWNIRNWGNYYASDFYNH